MRCVGNFETEPYEVGWASEARWFVHAFEFPENTAMELIPQISFDGLFWCDYIDGNSKNVTIKIETAGLYSLPLALFGQWLRLRAVMAKSAESNERTPGISIQLVLKG